MAQAKPIIEPPLEEVQGYYEYGDSNHEHSIHSSSSSTSNTAQDNWGSNDESKQITNAKDGQLDLDLELDSIQTSSVSSHDNIIKTSNLQKNESRSIESVGLTGNQNRHVSIDLSSDSSQGCCTRGWSKHSDIINNKEDQTSEEVLNQRIEASKSESEFQETKTEKPKTDYNRPWVTTMLSIAISAIHFYPNHEFVVKYVPNLECKIDHPWQFLSYALRHDEEDWGHLGGNLFSTFLCMFTEMKAGSLITLMNLFVGSIFGGMFHCFTTDPNDLQGFSGAIRSLMFYQLCIHLGILFFYNNDTDEKEYNIKEALLEDLGYCARGVDWLVGRLVNGKQKKVSKKDKKRIEKLKPVSVMDKIVFICSLGCSIWTIALIVFDFIGEKGVSARAHRGGMLSGGMFSGIKFCYFMYKKRKSNKNIESEQILLEEIV